MNKIYKEHADAIYNQTGQAGEAEYWEKIASNPKCKSAKRQQAIFNRIDSIIGGDKAVAE